MRTKYEIKTILLFRALKKAILIHELWKIIVVYKISQWHVKHNRSEGCLWKIFVQSWKRCNDWVKLGISILLFRIKKKTPQNLNIPSHWEDIIFYYFLEKWRNWTCVYGFNYFVTSTDMGTWSTMYKGFCLLFIIILKSYFCQLY